MELFLIDAIGPFFRNHTRSTINWSKIPFSHLATSGPEATEQWQLIHQDMRDFAREISNLGYNAVTLDDLAHLATHPLHEPDIAASISFFREQFSSLFDLLTEEYGLMVFLTSDVIPVTPAIEKYLSKKHGKLDEYYISLVANTLDDFPQLSGVILRIGESDGVDVKDPIRTRLHLRNAHDTNRLIKKLLPEFDARNKRLILRTWTVGAHKIGDLIWHRDTLKETLADIDSPSFIVSMKHGESDFFRHLPLNKAFFHVKQSKIIELQARREYEGAGEFPSFIGADCEQFARELEQVETMIGVSVWCQTGGWHRFQRLAFLEGNRHSCIWIRLNAAAAIHVFRYKWSVEQSVEHILGADRAQAALELLRHTDTVISEIFYLKEFATKKLFFRRVRIPPIIHIYWESLFINQAVSEILNHFIADPLPGIRSSEAAHLLFPRMIRLARKADLPVDDIEHMRDLFNLILLARRYYFMPPDEAINNQIRVAKKLYKQNYPSGARNRYRIKISFVPFHLKRRTLSWLFSLLLRKQRGYRLIDHMFTLHLLGFIYRVFKPRDPKKIPKLLRKSAMGMDALFK